LNGLWEATPQAISGGRADALLNASWTLEFSVHDISMRLSGHNYDGFLVEAHSFGTFSISSDERIEIIWDSTGTALFFFRGYAVHPFLSTTYRPSNTFDSPGDIRLDDRGIRVHGFAQTDNTIEIGGLRFVRAR